MPFEFKNVVTIRTLSEDDLKMEFVKGNLLEFNKNRSMKTSGDSRSDAPSSFAVSSGQIKCGRMGHTKYVCGIECFKWHKIGDKSAKCKINQGGTVLSHAIQAITLEVQEDCDFIGGGHSDEFD